MDARRVDGTTKSEVDAERSRRRAALATDTVRSDKYPGAAPFKQRDGWAVTFGTARRGPGGLGPQFPPPSSLHGLYTAYQM